jgi:hypothetical protein
LERLMVDVAAADVSVSETAATTPLAMVFELRPDAMQTYAAAPPLHATDLPAAVAEAPATTLTFAMLAAG